MGRSWIKWSARLKPLKEIGYHLDSICTCIVYIVYISVLKYMFCLAYLVWPGSIGITNGPLVQLYFRINSVSILSSSFPPHGVPSDLHPNSQRIDLNFLNTIYSWTNHRSSWSMWLKTWSLSQRNKLSKYSKVQYPCFSFDGDVENTQVRT